MVGAAGFEPATPAVWRQCFLRGITLNARRSRVYVTESDPNGLEWTHSGHSDLIEKEPLIPRDQSQISVERSTGPTTSQPSRKGADLVLWETVDSPIDVVETLKKQYEIAANCEFYIGY